MDEKRYRVAQWGTGHTGKRSLKTVIEHPQYDLVGVRVYSEAKAGVDAGDLCDAPKTGVLATQDIAQIIAARPDCIVYMPMSDGASHDDICRLLESGANIVTLITDFHHPDSLDPAVRQRVEDACRRGGTSLYATGASPGFSTEMLPLTLAAFQRRFDRLRIDEFADMSQRNSPGLIAQMFGQDPATMDLSQVAETLRHDMGTSIRQLADALRVPVDDVIASGAVAVAANTVQIGVTTIAAGTVAAWRMDVTGMRGGKPFISFSPTWYVSKDLDPAWDVRDSGWHIVVDGDAPLDIDIRFTTDDYHTASPGYNAHICVNAVATVCDAPPGIQTTVTLPRIIPNFG